METAEKEELLGKYADLVIRYNSIFDLTNAKDKNDFVENHIGDALCAADNIRRLIPEGCEMLFDIGSGCGVPGIPLSIELGMETVLIERGSRRADFLSLCVASLGLTDMVHVYKSDFAETKGSISFAVSRALGKFEDMEKDLYDCLCDGGVLVMYKGKHDKTGKTKLSHFKSSEIITLEGGDKERCLLVLRK